jgi:hypothetical protein
MAYTEHISRKMLTLRGIRYRCPDGWSLSFVPPAYSLLLASPASPVYSSCLQPLNLKNKKEGAIKEINGSPDRQAPLIVETDCLSILPYTVGANRLSLPLRAQIIPSSISVCLNAVNPPASRPASSASSRDYPTLSRISDPELHAFSRSSPNEPICCWLDLLSLQPIPVLAPDSPYHLSLLSLTRVSRPVFRVCTPLDQLSDIALQLHRPSQLATLTCTTRYAINLDTMNGWSPPSKEPYTSSLSDRPSSSISDADLQRSSPEPVPPRPPLTDIVTTTRSRAISSSIGSPVKRKPLPSTASPLATRKISTDPRKELPSLLSGGGIQQPFNNSLLSPNPNSPPFVLRDLDR